MKITKSARKAKPSANISRSNPQTPEAHIPTAELLRNIIEAIKAESDPSSLIAVMMPSSLLESESGQLEEMIGEGLLGEGMIRQDILGLLLPKELFKFHIIDMICGDEAISQPVLELIYLILLYRIKFGSDSGEIMASEMKKILLPAGELKDTFSAAVEEQKKSLPPVRRRRPRLTRPPTVKTRKSKTEN